MQKKVIRAISNVKYNSHTELLFTHTVASRPKILQNNSKPAPENIGWPRKICGRTAAIFGQKGPKKNLMKKMHFS
jgi:hypothetical protein